MRRLAAILLAALLLVPQGTAATETLEDVIAAATHISRPISAGLQAYAQQRALQVVTDFSHDGWCGCTYEVIAWNQGYADPAAEAVTQWMGSPDHRAIITNPSLQAIGCGSTTVAGRFYAVCELNPSAGSSPVPSPPAPRGPAVLPNTATRPR